MPRAEAARGRLRAAAKNGIHRFVDGKDGALALQSVAAAVAGTIKRPRVLALVHPQLVPPDSLEGHSEQEINNWKTPYDLVSTLRAAGHAGRPPGVAGTPKP